MEVEKAAKNAPPRPEGEYAETLMPVEESTSEEALAAAFSMDTRKPIAREEED